MTRADLTFISDKSLKGKGTSTMSPRHITLLNGLPVGYAVNVLAQIAQILEGAAVLRHMRYAGHLGILLDHYLNLLVLKNIDSFRGAKTPSLKMA